MSRFGGKSSNSEWMIDGKWNSSVFNWLVARTAYGLTDRSHETGLLAATIHLSAGAALQQLLSTMNTVTPANGANASGCTACCFVAYVLNWIEMKQINCSPAGGSQGGLYDLYETRPRLDGRPHVERGRRSEVFEPSCMTSSWVYLLAVHLQRITDRWMEPPNAVCT